MKETTHQTHKQTSMDGIDENTELKRMESWCAAAEHCRAEAVEKLVRRGVPYDMADRIADRLEKEKFIDERRYCQAFIHDKFRFAKWGKQKIDMALRQKKLDPYVYRPLLNEIASDEYGATLQALLEAKRKSIRAATEYERNAKLMRFALSRGFAADDIRRCIDLPDENEREA